MIALCIGDLNGIGPEVTLRAAQDARFQDEQLVLIGPKAIWRGECVRLGLPSPRTWNPGARWPMQQKLVIWEPAGLPDAVLQPGSVQADAARLALDVVGHAIDGCRAGIFSGMVTAPISKEGLMLAGLNWPGHTEFLAARAGGMDVGMLLVAEPLRVFLLTRHIPLRDVADSITPDVLKRGLKMLCRALPWLGADGGEVAVCGLNPHAGDGGALGREEIEIITPTLHELQKEGLPVQGPFPADTIFYQAAQGAYPVVAAMYHDQGLAPLKLFGFDKGVNITLGLPFVRTSPDHGTAFNLAHTGKASPLSMIAAIATALDLSTRPHPWGKR